MDNAKSLDDYRVVRGAEVRLLIADDGDDDFDVAASDGEPRKGEATGVGERLPGDCAGVAREAARTERAAEPRRRSAGRGRCAAESNGESAAVFCEAAAHGKCARSGGARRRTRQLLLSCYHARRGARKARARHRRAEPLGPSWRSVNHSLSARSARELEPRVGEPRRAGGGAASLRARYAGDEANGARSAFASRTSSTPADTARAAICGRRTRASPHARCRRRAALLGAEDRERTERAVDVQPQVFRGAEVGERVQIVEGAGIDGTGRRDDEEGLRAAGAVARDGRAHASTSTAPSASVSICRSAPDPSPAMRIALATESWTPAPATR